MSIQRYIAVNKYPLKLHQCCTKIQPNRCFYIEIRRFICKFDVTFRFIDSYTTSKPFRKYLIHLAGRTISIANHVMLSTKPHETIMNVVKHCSIEIGLPL